MSDKIKIQKIDDCRFRISREGKMRTDGLIFVSEAMLSDLLQDQSLQQVANVAWLPGIVGPSLAMPDIHWGYGFPIGGVAAFDPDQGVVSPGGVGYDINCGVRLLRSGLSRKEIEGRIKEIVGALFRNIPSGVGSHRKDFKLSAQDRENVLGLGARWAVNQGFGRPEDLEHIEEGGCMEGARPDLVSARAMERGKDQLGTLGSGNHFVEVGYVETIYDPPAARGLGLFDQQVTVMVHTGSRGLGHQVCDDAIKKLIPVTAKYGIELPDRQLCCAPISSPEGREYLAVMAAAANFAFANRQVITHWVQETLERVLRIGPKTLQLELVYDLCHNIAKFEDHQVDGRMKRLCVHRKGATRAFPPNHPQIPLDYREMGQPVLIPGDMGRYSYVLVGTQRAMEETFGSTCHGAGRVQSRTQAKRAGKGRSLHRELEDKGIYVMAANRATLMEEAPEAYKDVSQVVEVVHRAGISRKVAKLRPWAVVKG